MPSAITNEQILAAVQQNGSKLDTVHGDVLALKSDVAMIADLPSRVQFAIEQLPSKAIHHADLARALGETRSMTNYQQFLRRHAKGQNPLWAQGKIGRISYVWSLESGAQPTEIAKFEDLTNCLHDEPGEEAAAEKELGCQPAAKKSKPGDESAEELFGGAAPAAEVDPDAEAAAAAAVEAEEAAAAAVEAEEAAAEAAEEASRKRKLQEKEETEKALMLAQEEALYTPAQQGQLEKAKDLMNDMSSMAEKAEKTFAAPCFEALVLRDHQQVPASRFDTIETKLVSLKAPIEAVRFVRDLRVAAQCVFPKQATAKAQFSESAPMGYQSTFHHTVHLPYLSKSQGQADAEMRKLLGKISAIRQEYSDLLQHALS